MPADANDPNSLYEYGQAGITPSYTSNLQNLGYVPTPFATQEQVFKNQYGFQQILKNILDAQMGQGEGGHNAFGGNTAMLPYNLRNMFSMASNIFNDPMYGRPGFADAIQNAGGWFSGGLPTGRQPAYENWWNAKNGYPSVPAPTPISGGSGGGGGGGAPPNQNKQFTVPIQGGGSMTVNAKDQASAITNASQGGNSYDSSRQVKQGGYQF